MDPFVAEVRPFAFNFPPKGWAFCAGQLLPLSQNTALFSLLGTTYGGNGTSNFALPDLQDRVPIGVGQGPGLSERRPGETGGSATVTLLTSEMPSHTHPVRASSQAGDLRAPGTGRTLAAPGNGLLYAPRSAAAPVAAHPEAAQPVGGDQPHNNLMPYLSVNYCIALQGVFPPRG